MIKGDRQGKLWYWEKADKTGEIYKWRRERSRKLNFGIMRSRRTSHVWLFSVKHGFALTAWIPCTFIISVC